MYNCLQQVRTIYRLLLQIQKKIGLLILIYTYLLFCDFNYNFYFIEPSDYLSRYNSYLH